MNKYILKFYRLNKSMCGTMDVWADNTEQIIKTAKDYTKLLLVGMGISIYEIINGAEYPLADIKKIK